MYEVRFHGRGGQGAVTAANILAVAANMEGYHSQAFPFFGVERRGAPVEAYTRISREPIELRTFVYTPDCVVVLDPSLLRDVDITSGLKNNGTIVINTEKSAKDLGLSGFRVATVNATDIAIKYGLGSKESPIVNTAILGAYARATGNISIDSIVKAIEESAPGKKKENASAAREAYERTVIE